MDFIIKAARLLYILISNLLTDLKAKPQCIASNIVSGDYSQSMILTNKANQIVSYLNCFTASWINYCTVKVPVI